MSGKRSVRTFTGFKRHVVKLVDVDVIVDAVVRPANEPEHATLAQVLPAITAHGPLGELFIDRGYLASPAIADVHAAGVAICAKAWTSLMSIGRHGFLPRFGAAPPPASVRAYGSTSTTVAMTPLA